MIAHSSNNASIDNLHYPNLPRVNRQYAADLVNHRGIWRGMLWDLALVAQPQRLTVGQQDAPSLHYPVQALLDLHKDGRVGGQQLV